MKILATEGTSEFGPFAALLAAQVFFLAFVPIVDVMQAGGTLLGLGFTVVMVAGLGIARENRSFLSIAVALLATFLAVRWAADWVLGEGFDRDMWRMTSGAAYLMYLILMLVRSLLHRTRAMGETSLDVVLGGINIYLLLALVFMLLHMIVEGLQPGAYAYRGLALSDPSNMIEGNLSTCLFYYFSFTTLTTLGYGDIVPTLPVSQFLCSAEAVIGQLFVAIFIGGLVALRIGTLRK